MDIALFFMYCTQTFLRRVHTLAVKVKTKQGLSRKGLKLIDGSLFSWIHCTWFMCLEWHEEIKKIIIKKTVIEASFYMLEKLHVIPQIVQQMYLLHRGLSEELWYFQNKSDFKSWLCGLVYSSLEILLVSKSETKKRVVNMNSVIKRKATCTKWY